MEYLVVAFFFGLAGGVVGRIKGSSFTIWFLISFLFPIIGLLAAVFSRYENEEMRRRCPNCGRVLMAYDALCTKCGAELDYPSDDELLAPAAYGR